IDMSGQANLVVLRNRVISNSNAAPAAITNASAAPNGTNVVLSWTAPSDANTPSAGLTYDLEIATEPLATAPIKMRTPSLVSPFDGNIRNTLFKFKARDNKTYYWHVRAVDASDVRGPWAEQPSLPVHGIAPDAISSFTATQGLQIDLNWFA